MCRHVIWFRNPLWWSVTKLWETNTNAMMCVIRFVSSMYPVINIFYPVRIVQFYKCFTYPRVISATIYLTVYIWYEICFYYDHEVEVTLWIKNENFAEKGWASCKLAPLRLSFIRVVLCQKLYITLLVQMYFLVTCCINENRVLSRFFYSYADWQSTNPWFVQQKRSNHTLYQIEFFFLAVSAFTLTYRPTNTSLYQKGCFVVQFFIQQILWTQRIHTITFLYQILLKKGFSYLVFLWGLALLK